MNSRMAVMTMSNVGTTPKTAAMIKNKVPMIHVSHAVYVRGHTITWAKRITDPSKRRNARMSNKVNMLAVMVYGCDTVGCVSV